MSHPPIFFVPAGILSPEDLVNLPPGRIVRISDPSVLRCIHFDVTGEELMGPIDPWENVC